MRSVLSSNDFRTKDFKLTHQVVKVNHVVQDMHVHVPSSMFLSSGHASYTNTICEWTYFLLQHFCPRKKSFALINTYKRYKSLSQTLLDFICRHMMPLVYEVC